MHSVRRCIAAVVLLLSHAACREVNSALGSTPAEVRAVATELFEALAHRFGPHVRIDTALTEFRTRVVRASFAPSRLFADAAAWPAHDGRAGHATYSGSLASDGAYRLTLRPEAPPPAHAGDYRGRLSLHKLDNGDFEWRLYEELAVGALRASAATHALTGALTAIERTPPEQATRALRAAWPRTAAALERAVAIERLRLQPDAHGGTLVLLGTRLRTDRLAAAGFPAYARFLDRYVMPLRYKFDLTDAQGSFGQLDVYEGRMLVSFRSRQGALAPLSGPPRPLPEHLRFTVDFTTAAGPFRVGVAGLTAELHTTGDAREKLWAAAFRNEPRWLLPFIVRPLLRAALRRPFEDPGLQFISALREPPAGPTLIVSEYSVVVRENWLVRWLGGLGTDAVEAFQREAEKQADRFQFELLDALRRDVLAPAAS